ncbi:MAG: DUF1223 domain-containing protein [Verrucomicrobiota bacterium]
MSRRTLLLFVILAGLSLALSAQGGELTFTSAPARTHLLELFTSEGCSSCPPAEAWLSKLKDAPGLWQNFVPMAFHVDYWDRLGWRDPFASKVWTARQYEYSGRWNSSSVYTPGFVLDGREWRNDGIPSVSAETPGILKISMTSPDSVTAIFQPAKADGRSFDVHVARLGFGLKINVKAGENSGRQLQHDFVVLSLADAAIGSGPKEVRLPASTVASNSRGAIAAWVTETGKTEPIQAVGGWQR